MRPTRIVVAALLLQASIFLPGCSNRADRIVGNKRLIRGPGGLGTSVGVVNVVNRDTYVTAGTPGAAIVGPALLLGRSGSFEARSLLRVHAWNLPNETLTGFNVIVVELVLPQRGILGVTGSLSADLSLTAAPFDPSVTWPGPTLGTQLGSRTYDFIGNFTVDLGPNGYNLIKQWKADTTTAPGFELVPTSSGRVGTFSATGAVFRIIYQHAGVAATDSTIETDSTDTHLSLGAYVNSPLIPAQTGTEPTMTFGGLYGAGLVLRASVPPIGEGNSVNEVRMILPVGGTIPAGNGAVMPDTVFLDLDILRIRAPWSEGVTDEGSLSTDSIAVSHVTLAPFYLAQGDTALSIPLPRALARELAADTTRNEGILVKIRNMNARPIPLQYRVPMTPAETPAFLIGSRESSRPPYLRLSTTSPPPGRF